MRPEILLKAYVLYQSEDAFRELVVGSLDEVYSTALRIVQRQNHLAEETSLRVYWALARKARGLGEHVVLASWLRECTCKMAVIVLREEGRPVDRVALKREKQAHSTADCVLAPPGLALRVCQGVLLNAARNKSFRFLLPQVLRPASIRPVHVRIGAVCLLALLVLWNIPFHKRNPIIQYPRLQMTPSSIAQLATPEEGEPTHLTNTNAQAATKQQ